MVRGGNGLRQTALADDLTSMDAEQLPLADPAHWAAVDQQKITHTHLSGEGVRAQQPSHTGLSPPTQSAPTPTPDRTSEEGCGVCCVCGETATHLLACTAGAHLTCAACLNTHTMHSCSLDHTNMERLMERQGMVQCPSTATGTCTTPCRGGFNLKELYSVLSEESLHAALAASAHVAKSEGTLAALGQLNQTDSSNKNSQQQARQELELYLQTQYPGAYQCKQCGRGPVIIRRGDCSDLAAHHHQRLRDGGTISNACAGCGWFSPDLNEWPKWDGKIEPDHNDDSDAESGAARLIWRRLGQALWNNLLRTQHACDWMLACLLTTVTAYLLADHSGWITTVGLAACNLAIVLLNLISWCIVTGWCYAWPNVVFASTFFFEEAVPWIATTVYGIVSTVTTSFYYNVPACMLKTVVMAYVGLILWRMLDKCFLWYAISRGDGCIASAEEVKDQADVSGIVRFSRGMICSMGRFTLFNGRLPIWMPSRCLLRYNEEPRYARRGIRYR